MARPGADQSRDTDALDCLGEPLYPFLGSDRLLQAHVPPRFEASMNSPRPNKTTGQLLAEFLAHQEACLGPKGYFQVAVIISLYGSYLEHDRPGRSLEEYDATVWPHETPFYGPFGAENLTGGFSEFLGDFLPHQVGPGTATMRAAEPVIKELTAWLAAKGYVGHHEEGLGQVNGDARDLAAARNLLDLLQDYLPGARPADSINDVEDHFLIHRIEPRQIWLESVMVGEVWGPIDVPVSIARACRVGWDIGGVVVHSTKGWRLLKVSSVSP